MTVLDGLIIRQERREGGRGSLLPAYLLGHAIRGARIEGGSLGLGHLLHLAVELRSGRLIKPSSFFEAAGTHGVEEAEGADAGVRGKGG